MDFESFSFHASPHSLRTAQAQWPDSEPCLACLHKPLPSQNLFIGLMPSGRHIQPLRFGEQVLFLLFHRSGSREYNIVLKPRTIKSLTQLFTLEEKYLFSCFRNYHFLPPTKQDKHEKDFRTKVMAQWRDGSVGKIASVHT